MITKKQIDYIRRLGGEADKSMSQEDASATIEALLSEKRAMRGHDAAPVSNRQMMVLRFWDKTELARNGREFVSRWLDEWYDSDPRRMEAWDNFKIDILDDGTQDDPEKVPVGEGYRYIERMQSDGLDLNPERANETRQGQIKSENPGICYIHRTEVICWQRAIPSIIFSMLGLPFMGAFFLGRKRLSLAILILFIVAIAQQPDAGMATSIYTLACFSVPVLAIIDLRWKVRRGYFVFNQQGAVVGN